MHCVGHALAQGGNIFLIFLRHGLYWASHTCPPFPNWDRKDWNEGSLGMGKKRKVKKRGEDLIIFTEKFFCIKHSTPPPISSSIRHLKSTLSPFLIYVEDHRAIFPFFFKSLSYLHYKPLRITLKTSPSKTIIPHLNRPHLAHHDYVSFKRWAPLFQLEAYLAYHSLTMCFFNHHKLKHLRSSIANLPPYEIFVVLRFVIFWSQLTARQ